MKIQRSFNRSIGIVTLLLALIAAAVIFVSCQDSAAESGGADLVAGSNDDLNAIAEARGLTPADMAAALKTYTPSGQHDPYIMFASGGHGGQMYVIGSPSMRIIKQIAVFTPEPWQGFGYGEEHSLQILADGSPEGSHLTWGDTHHPALSETDGD